MYKKTSSFYNIKFNAVFYYNNMPMEHAKKVKGKIFVFDFLEIPTDRYLILSKAKKQYLPFYYMK